MPNDLGRFDEGELIAARFRVIEPIAEGGMGAVYRARDEHENRRVALKQCLPELSLADRRRFGREVRAMLRISHPHVMPVLHAELDAEHPFFVMPEATCRLDERADELRQDADSALAAFEQICDGVIAIHEAGEVHRDLKPLNILLLLGRWVVSDLGLVGFTEGGGSQLTRTHSLIGTDAYIAPERRRGRRDPDVREDVFSLGMVLYELMTGSDTAYVDEDLLPSALRAIVLRAVEPNPAKRTASVTELRHQLKAYRATLRPDFDPFGRARELVATGRRLNIEHLDEFVRTFALLEDEPAITVFDEVSDAQLAALASSSADSLQALLTRYAEALRGAVGRQNFAYAETVASRMGLVRSVTKRRSLDVVALRCVLIAAVDLWRYAALDSFDAMLEAVTSPALAEEIAAMLLDERVRASQALNRGEPGKLAEPIRRARAILVAAAPATGAG